MATKWDTARDEWLDYVDATANNADRDCRGYIIAPERQAEFNRKYGTWYITTGMFSDFNAATAYYYASEELISWWEQHPRQTWPEYAVTRGIYFAHITRAARRAPAARQDAANRAANRRKVTRGLYGRVA